MSITVSFGGDGIRRFKQLAWELGSGKARKIYSRSINDTGGTTATATGSALSDQSGVTKTAAKRALRDRTKATPSSLSYTIEVKGGAVRYKYFKGTRETKKGVSTAPRGNRMLLKRHFLNAGWAPTRVKKSGWNGHVMTIGGPGKSGLTVARSNVFLPEEVITGDTAQAFDAGKRSLDARVSHNLKRMAKGALS